MVDMHQKNAGHMPFRVESMLRTASGNKWPEWDCVVDGERHIEKKKPIPHSRSDAEHEIESIMEVLGKEEMRRYVEYLDAGGKNSLH